MSFYDAPKFDNLWEVIGNPKRQNQDYNQSLIKTKMFVIICCKLSFNFSNIYINWRYNLLSTHQRPLDLDAAG